MLQLQNQNQNQNQIRVIWMKTQRIWATLTTGSKRCQMHRIA